MGYCIHKIRWQQGFGNEIVMLLLAWLKAHGATKFMAADKAIDSYCTKD
ncbi:MAG: hypothetical protein ACI4DR_10235 [Roseburia sp.]